MSPHFIRIDALRGVAILMVMQLHIFFITFTYDYLNFPTAARYLLRSGGAGVDLFFILSAYLLTTNLLRQRDRPGVITTFFARRALRILPMFLILILAHPGFRGDEAMLGGCATRGCVEMTRLRLLSCSAFT